MKKRIYPILLVAATLVTAAFTATNHSEPWTEEQLMAPADLARMLNDSANLPPLVLNIGSVGDIKGAEDMGAARGEDGLDNLRLRLTTVPKDADIVIYCGCCPFQNCPNIRPAFSLLNEMKFTHHKLLNLPENLKVDWIDKGYPMN